MGTEHAGQLTINSSLLCQSTYTNEKAPTCNGADADLDGERASRDMRRIPHNGQSTPREVLNSQLS